MEEKRLLLHICCAPDSTVPWPELLAEGWSVTGFMYGGNIHPGEEYARRSRALLDFAAHIGRRVEICEYDTENWITQTELYACEPEGGKRCSVCFYLQLQAAARFAYENAFTHLSTTLTISPHKDPELINSIGRNAAAEYGLVWVDRVWRKNDGFKRSVAESKRLAIYRQNYCGCIYSMPGEKND